MIWKKSFFNLRRGNFKLLTLKEKWDLTKESLDLFFREVSEEEKKFYLQRVQRESFGEDWEQIVENSKSFEEVKEKLDQLSLRLI